MSQVSVTLPRKQSREPVTDLPAGEKSPGQPPTDEEVKKIIQEVDLDGDGTINFNGEFPGQGPMTSGSWQLHKSAHADDLRFAEFITMMTGHPYPPPAEAPAPEVPVAAAPPAQARGEADQDAEYSKAWAEFEPSLNGSITQSQFRQLMDGLAEPVSDAEIDQLVNNVDGEGKISCEYSFSHFQHLCTCRSDRP